MGKGQSRWGVSLFAAVMIALTAAGITGMAHASLLGSENPDTTNITPSALGGFDVKPTGDSEFDLSNVQWAVDNSVGGTVVLKSKNGANVTTAFDFGTTPEPGTQLSDLEPLDSEPVFDPVTLTVNKADGGEAGLRITSDVILLGDTTNNKDKGPFLPNGAWTFPNGAPTTVIKGGWDTIAVGAAEDNRYPLLEQQPDPYPFHPSVTIKNIEFSDTYQYTVTVYAATDVDISENKFGRILPTSRLRTASGDNFPSALTDDPDNRFFWLGAIAMGEEEVPPFQGGYSGLEEVKPGECATVCYEVIGNAVVRNNLIDPNPELDRELAAEQVNWSIFITSEDAVFKIEDNTLLNYGHAGILMGDHRKDVTIINNRLESGPYAYWKFGHAGSGIVGYGGLSPLTNPVSGKFIITGNTIETEDPEAWGISLSNSSMHTPGEIKDNTVMMRDTLVSSGWLVDGEFGDRREINLDRRRLNPVSVTFGLLGGPAIFVGQNDTIVTGNTIAGDGVFGMVFVSVGAGADNNTVTGNTFNFTPKIAAMLVASSNNTVSTSDDPNTYELGKTLDWRDVTPGQSPGGALLFGSGTGGNDVLCDVPDQGCDPDFDSTCAHINDIQGANLEAVFGGSGRCQNPWQNAFLERSVNNLLRRLTSIRPR